jgi:hypothetical protein
VRASDGDRRLDSVELMGHALSESGLVGQGRGRKSHDHEDQIQCNRERIRLELKKLLAAKC